MHGLFRKSEPDFLIFFSAGGFRCDANVVPPLQSSPFAFLILTGISPPPSQPSKHMFLLAYYVPVTAYSVFICGSKVRYGFASPEGGGRAEILFAGRLEIGDGWVQVVIAVRFCFS